MGWFSKPEKTSDDITSWLNKVDTAYDKAYRCKQPYEIEKYFDRSLLQMVLDELHTVDKEIYSGLSKYRKTTWDHKLTKQLPTFIKVVKYDHIKIAKGIIAPVGEDYEEEWVLTSLGDDKRVKSIRRL